MNKSFKSIDEQIQLLKSRNLTFLNKETARNELIRWGYYEIINGYKSPFLLTKEGDEHYLTGTTFEQLLAFYNFDKNLRFHTLYSMLDVESTLKTAVAYVVTKDFKSVQKDYLQKENYDSGNKKYNKEKDKYEYDIDQLFHKFNFILNDNTQPFRHYRIKHKNIPPWILIKGMSFENIYVAQIIESTSKEYGYVYTFRCRHKFHNSRN